MAYLEKGVTNYDVINHINLDAFQKRQQENLKMEKVNNMMQICTISLKCSLYNDALNFSRKALADLKKIKQNYEEFNKKFPNFYNLNETEILIAVNIFFVGISLLSLGDEECALKKFNEALEIFKKTSPNLDNDILVAMVLWGIALCLYCQQKPAEAIIKFDKSRKVLSTARWSVEPSVIFIQVLCSTADCLFALNDNEKAIELLLEALDVFEKDLKNTDSNRLRADILFKLGYYKKLMGKDSEAMDYFKDTLEVYKNSTFDIEIELNVAFIFEQISECLYANDNYKELFETLQKAKNIVERVSENKSVDEYFADILQQLGMCKKQMNDFDDAEIYLKEALKIFLRIKLPKTQDKISWTYFLMGRCFYEQNKFEEATPYLVKNLVMDKEMHLLITKSKDQKIDFKDSSEIAEMIPVPKLIALCKIVIEDSSFSGATCEHVLNMLGYCLFYQNQYDDALAYLKKSLQVQEKIPDDEKQNVYFVLTLSAIGYCYDIKGNYREALVYFIKQESIYEKNILNSTNNSSVVICINAIANCFKNLSEFENAVSYFKKVSKILDNVDVTPFVILNQLKLCICSLHLKNLTEAEVHLSKPFEVCKQLSIFQNLNEDDNLSSSFIIYNNELENCIAEVHEWLRKHNQDETHKNLFEKLFFFVDEFYKIKSK